MEKALKMAMDSLQLVSSTMEAVKAAATEVHKTCALYEMV